MGVHTRNKKFLVPYTVFNLDGSYLLETFHFHFPNIRQIVEIEEMNDYDEYTISDINGSFVQKDLDTFMEFTRQINHPVHINMERKKKAF